MIYVDSCVPIYAALDSGSKGKWSRSLLDKIEDGVEPALTSALTLDEFTYKVRKEEGVEVSVEAGRRLLTMPHFRFIPVDDGVLWKSLELVEEYGIYPRDAIHASTAIIQGISSLVSEDENLDVLSELDRRWLD